MSNPFYSGNTHLGILGGGQLGRMMIREAIDMDIHISVLDPARNCPCAPYANEFVLGDFRDYHTVKAFGAQMDVLTVEIEQVNTQALKELRDAGKTVYPSPENLEMIRDKGLQKQFFETNGLPTAPFTLIASSQDIHQFPIVQKARTGGYDGKGVQVLRLEEQLKDAFDTPSVLEELADIEKEIAILIARNPQGEVAIYPVVEMLFDPDANLVDNLIAPARISEVQRSEAEGIAKKLIDAMDYVGILAVEMFVNRDGSIWINEIAPRPHNSGHHTIEACMTSQFEQHLRAVLGLPLGSTHQWRAACMLNLLGTPGESGSVIYQGIEKALSEEGVFIHLYGKSETKPFRKMGHLTVLAHSVDAALEKGLQIRKNMHIAAKQ